MPPNPSHPHPPPPPGPPSTSPMSFFPAVLCFTTVFDVPGSSPGQWTRPSFDLWGARPRHQVEPRHEMRFGRLFFCFFFVFYSVWPDVCVFEDAFTEFDRVFNSLTASRRGSRCAATRRPRARRVFFLWSRSVGREFSKRPRMTDSLRK